jgi:hypothetical protein
MAKTIIAHSAQEPQSRIERGRRLYAVHTDEIVFEDGVWYVPSENEHTTRYEVRLGRVEVCACADLEYSGLGFCKHIVAATLRKSKTFLCCGCGDRFPNGELYEAPEDHLTWFPGDPLCRDCALHPGVL